ncbi:MAG: membrane integrity-associated transporter subunit PqiC [Acetobacteraceae bacterium]|nr:membrane integrity-associated transporter subunit PqiC [Acetobacteraceae bacterium]
MRARHLGRRALLAGAPLALASCASPNPTLYTLAAVPGQPLPGGPRSAELRRVGLAGYLDRPAVVRSTDDYRLQLAHDDRWGAPLGEMIERVLDEDLSQRLPDCTVYTESGAISTSPDRIVEIDMQRFDGDARGNVVLAAEVAVRPGDSHTALGTRTVRLSVTPRSPATADFVAALSAALGQLADATADMLRAAQPQPAAEARATRARRR